MIINSLIDTVGGGGGSQTTWYGTCSTAAGTAAKVVDCSDFTLSTGAIIGILFTAANTAATPTLNVNSTGAKSVYVGNGVVNSTTNVLKWSANTMLYFMYDGTYFRYIGSVAAGGVVQPDGAGTWYGTCSTAAGTAAKASAITNFRLTKGALVAVTFTTANTVSGALTLNINSTGAKTIYRKNAATSASNVLTWQAKDTLLFIYSGSYWYYLGGSSDEGGGGGGGGSAWVDLSQEFTDAIEDATYSVIDVRAKTDGTITVFNAYIYGTETLMDIYLDGFVSSAYLPNEMCSITALELNGPYQLNAFFNGNTIDLTSLNSQFSGESVDILLSGTWVCMGV